MTFPDTKVHVANMGPIWGRQAPGGPHVGPMNFVIWVEISFTNTEMGQVVEMISDWWQGSTYYVVTVNHMAVHDLLMQWGRTSTAILLPLYLWIFQLQQHKSQCHGATLSCHGICSTLVQRIPTHIPQCTILKQKWEHVSTFVTNWCIVWYLFDA